jgi:hypothetical protein
MKLPIINKEKLKQFLISWERFPWFLGNHVFPLFLSMIFLAVIITITPSFTYFLSLQRQVSDLPKLPVFDKQNLEEILSIWKSRQEGADKIDGQTYSNFFGP